MELETLQIPVILSKETQKRIASKVGIAADIQKDFWDAWLDKFRTGNHV